MILPPKAVYHILNLGCGTQSSWLKKAFDSGRIAGEDGQPIMIDVAIFADTKEEPRIVYKQLEWLAKGGGAPIMVASIGSLGDDLIRTPDRYRIKSGERYASIPAFTTNRDFAEELERDMAKLDNKQLAERMKEFSLTVSKRGTDELEDWFSDDDETASQSEFSARLFARWEAHARRGDKQWCLKAVKENVQVGMTRRQCTKDYKIDVINKAIKNMLGYSSGESLSPQVSVVQYIGISLDEAGRALRIKKRFSETRWASVRFPIIELGLSRQDCGRELSTLYNLPWEPPRSSCTCCPFHDDQEWLAIQSVREDWERACAIDEGIRQPCILSRGLRQKLYLHQSCRPLRTIDFIGHKAKTKHETLDLFASNPNFRGECGGVCGN